MILLTGASGLLGHNVLITLLQRGKQVIAPLRDASRLHLPASLADSPNLHIIPMEGIQFPLPESAIRHSNISAIINCSGETDMSLPTINDYMPANKDLVEHLVMLMRDHDIPTMVHVSTANTIGYGSPDNPATEAAPFQEPFTDSFYAHSKRDAEQMLERVAHDDCGRSIVVVNPGYMIGAYDIKPSSGKLLLAGYKRRWLAVPKGGKSFVHVRDAAEAVVNAVTMGINGERYLLTGESMTLKEFYKLQAEVCGYKQRVLVLPDILVLAAGKVGDMLQWMKIRTQLCTRNVRQLLVCTYYDNSKACRQLAMPQTPIADAIKEFFEWDNKCSFPKHTMKKKRSPMRAD